MLWHKKKSIIGSCGNPTGLGVRNDKGGRGHYGAPRTRKLANGKLQRYLHKGTDYSCEPGQIIKSPMTGIIVRRAKPYVQGEYSGVLIVTKRVTLKMFYLDPFTNLIGKVVKIGDSIGIAQDISKKYPLVTPHIHVEITRCDPTIFINNHQNVGRRSRRKDNFYQSRNRVRA